MQPRTIPGRRPATEPMPPSSSARHSACWPATRRSSTRRPASSCGRWPPSSAGAARRPRCRMRRRCSAAVVSPLVGSLMDRFGIRRVIACSAVVFGGHGGHGAAERQQGAVGLAVGAGRRVGAATSVLGYLAVLPQWFDRRLGWRWAGHVRPGRGHRADADERAVSPRTAGALPTRRWAAAPSCCRCWPARCCANGTCRRAPRAGLPPRRTA